MDFENKNKSWKKYCVCGVYRANCQENYSEPIIYHWDHMEHVNRFCFLIDFEWSTFVSINCGLVCELRNSVAQRYRKFCLSTTSNCRNSKKVSVVLAWHAHCTVHMKIRKLSGSLSRLVLGLVDCKRNRVGFIRFVMCIFF